MSSSLVYFFAPGQAEGDPARKDILGGKGASLAAMCRAGLPVPPGFTISAECCRSFLGAGGRWPDGLREQVRQYLARLQETVGRRFGDPAQPLLVSVRSGAAVSMPGMMDTILNCGLDVRHADQAADPEGFWRVYSQFVFMFARTAGGIDPAELEQARQAIDADERGTGILPVRPTGVPPVADELATQGRDGPATHGRDAHATAVDRHRRLVAAWHELYRRRTGREFPLDPWDVLVECVNTVFRSWNSERAIAYRARQNVTGLVGTAVNIQAMFPSHVSGIVFTANPNNLPAGEMIIESSFGLGEAVVSGDVHPDTFLVDRETLAVKSSRIGHKSHVVFALGDEGSVEPDAPSLDQAQLAELAKIALDVERFFDHGVDIEWGLADGRFALLQARPIKGLDEAQAQEDALAAARRQLRALLSEKRGPWVLHNLAETLGQPSPLTWSLMRRFMSPVGGFGKLYRDAGFEPSTELGEEGFLTLIAGRIYMDASRAGEMFCEGYPYRYDLDLLRVDVEASQAPPTVPAGSIAARRRCGRLADHANRTLRLQARDLDRRLVEEAMPAFAHFCRAEKAVDLAALSSQEWIDRWERLEQSVLGEFAPLSLLPSLIAAMALQDLRTFLAEHFWDLDEDVDELASAIAAPRHRDMTLQSNIDLFALAQGRLELSQWLDRYGYRAAGEFDLAKPRWREQSEQVLAMAGRLHGGADPEQLHRAHLDRTQAQVESLSARLDAATRRQFDDLLSLARRYLAFREDGKHYLMLGYDLLRDLALEAGRRLGVGQDVFFLTDAEVKQAIKGGTAVSAVRPTGVPPVCGARDDGRDCSENDNSHNKTHGQDGRDTHGRDAHATPQAAWADAIARRKREYQAHSRLSLPRIIDAAAVETLGCSAPPASADSYQALPISPGQADGPAWIVRSPTQAEQRPPGYVLVCPSTDPAWAPLFVNAAALILECGGSLSHGAIVAREMGIPAVVLPQATRMLQQGEEVGVDGRHGQVWRSAAEPASRPAGSSAAQAAPRRASPADVRIAPALRIPPRSARERTLARVRRYAFAFWALFLAAAFALPEAWLYQPSMDALDAALWPLVPALGKVGAVAAIAGAMAIATMLLQRALCDNRRLREARRRSALLARQAAALPADAPRRRALLLASGGLQARLLGSAMVPIALLLGPMILVFLWLPGRVDPASWNAPPGSSVRIVAQSATAAGDDSSPAPLRIDVPAPFELDETTPADFIPPDIRPPLRRLLDAQTRSAAEPAPRSAGSSAAATQPVEQLTSAQSQSLRAFLDDGAVQAASWLLRCPADTAGAFAVAVTRGSERLTARIVLGDSHPPVPAEVAASPGGALRSLRVVYPAPPVRKVFWAPLGFLGLGHWELGWLSVYLLVYLPAMFAARWVLRVA